MVNVQLLGQAMTHIIKHPELHHQTGCYEVNEFGVAACLAGRTLLLAGYEPMLPMIDGARSSLAQNPRTHEIVSVWNEARDILGLAREQASNLFAPSNTRLMLEKKVNDLLKQSPLERYSDLIVLG